LGNITALKLYDGSFAGTKFLIEEYITRVAEAIEDIGSLPTSSSGDGHPVDWRDGGSGMSTQMKLDFVHDTRQAFGRSTLVLQGGAIFGLCHLGVVKALFLRGLLPRIITGTATGALIAALVAIHNEEELPGVLRGDGIDLTAFAAKINGEGSGESMWTRLQTLKRRVARFWRDGYFLDVKVLEECVKANVGEMTFEEAYNRSKRVLNITVATGGQGGVPTLLNYLTAPNVVCLNGSMGTLVIGVLTVDYS
jgi:TAG lipase/lysophosphatidylethanolamine acyltransferase